MSYKTSETNMKSTKSL